MHKTELSNYLPIEKIGGMEFMEQAREQGESFEADLRVGEGVTDVEQDGDGFTVKTDDGGYDAKYIVFATGTDTDL